jgi:hypothetical protein
MLDAYGFSWWWWLFAGAGWAAIGWCCREVLKQWHAGHGVRRWFVAAWNASILAMLTVVAVMVTGAPFWFGER